MLFAKSALFFLLLSLPQPARADILFIGLNTAPGEIKAAQEAAKALKENLVLWPRVATSSVAKLEKLNKEEAALILAAAKDTSDEALEKIADRMVAIAEEREIVTKSLNVNTETLRKELQGLNERNARLSAVILSGHDGNGKFWGSYGDAFTAQALQKIFAEFPSLTAPIRTVALLGCYTTSIGALDTHWKAVFPGAAVFGGYEQRGPLASVPAGHCYLKDFLLRADRLAKAPSKAEMMRLFSQLSQVKILAASVATADYHVSHAGVYSVPELYKRCENMSADSDLRKSFDCYYQAEKGCENVPKDTGRGVLRRFYEELQANTHCIAFGSIVGDHALPSAEVALSLLYFESVRGNFARLYRRELDSLDRSLNSIGLKPLELASRPRSRAELMTAVREARLGAQAFGEGLARSEGSKSAIVNRSRVLLRLEQVDKILLRLQKGCVPSEWVDPLVTAKSACFSAEGTIEQNADKEWEKWVKPQN